MKIVHIESGLGNQMLSYSEYLVLKKLNPEDEFYIETMIYDIPACNDIICQWNGYELNRVFGIDVPNIKDYFSQQEWNEIIAEVENSKFWIKNWNYPPKIVKVFNNHGLNLINCRGDFGDKTTKKSKITKLLDTRFGYFVKRVMRPIYQKKYIEKMSATENIFLTSKKNIFTGQFLGLRNTGGGIEFVDKEIREAFQFPLLTDNKNLKALELIEKSNSIAIHARRGDMLQSNGYCYKYGYFKRAVSYIRARVKDPIFIFFCDTGSIEWCKQNEKIFGLDFRKDKIYFVYWNKGKESFRDMQLMSRCKHNIITNSTFGWWGAYFNDNPDKITISPNVWIATTVTL